MSGSRRVLIVSASIGAGHDRAAGAIQAAWELERPGDSIHIIDFMAEDNSHFNYLIKELYLKALAVSPDLYETLYRWTQGARTGSKVQDMLSWVMRRSMSRIIQQYRPDLVICTHPFPCVAMAYLKRKNKWNIPIAGVITDFSIHSLWINHEVNKYIVAASELKTDLLKRGIRTSRISATGIPIHPDFSHAGGSTFFRPLRRSGKAKPAILIMGGGLGIGRMQDLLLSLNNSTFALDITAVAGSNTALRADLQAIAQKSPHNVKVLGYTEHIREFMQAADLLITKPGALTISEALAAELPMLLFEAIPGQEIDNAAFVIRKGAARWLTEGTVDALLADDAALAAMRTAARQISRPQSALSAVRCINSNMDQSLWVSGIRV